MRVLGIDPGTSKDNFGWGIIDINKEKHGFSYCDSGIYRLSPKLSFGYKLRYIGEHVSDLIADYGVELMSVEAFFAFGKTKGAGRIHQLRGVLEYMSAVHDIPFVDIAPMTVKKVVTGSGKASKKQVSNAVAKHLGVPELKKRTSHETDALAIALCGRHIQLKKSNE